MQKKKKNPALQEFLKSDFFFLIETIVMTSPFFDLHILTGLVSERLYRLKVWSSDITLP